MAIERERDISPERKPDDVVEVSLRPRRLEEYIGQDRVRANLEILLEAARARSEALDHVLFYGPPGLGKTTLSFIIANEMGVTLRTTSGPAIERAGDLAAILTNLGPHDVLFIDEVHRLRSDVEEVLYSAMEDFALDIVVGKGPAASSIRTCTAPASTIHSPSPGRACEPTMSPSRRAVSCGRSQHRLSDASPQAPLGWSFSAGSMAESAADG